MRCKASSVTTRSLGDIAVSAPNAEMQSIITRVSARNYAKAQRRLRHKWDRHVSNSQSPDILSLGKPVLLRITSRAVRQILMSRSLVNGYGALGVELWFANR